MAGLIESIGDAPLVEVLSDLGGFPVTSSDWESQAHTWQLEPVLGQLRGFYNAPVLIRMMVDIDDKNSSVRIIQVRDRHTTEATRLVHVVE